MPNKFGNLLHKTFGVQRTSWSSLQPFHSCIFHISHGRVDSILHYFGFLSVKQNVVILTPLSDKRIHIPIVFQYTIYSTNLYRLCLIKRDNWHRFRSPTPRTRRWYYLFNSRNIKTCWLVVRKLKWAVESGCSQYTGTYYPIFPMFKWLRHWLNLSDIKVVFDIRSMYAYVIKYDFSMHMSIMSYFGCHVFRN